MAIDIFQKGSHGVAALLLKWEYLSYCCMEEGEQRYLDQILNDYGEQGWELVSVTSPTEEFDMVYYFKRLKVGD